MNNSHAHHSLQMLNSFFKLMKSLLIYVNQQESYYFRNALANFINSFLTD